MTNNRLNVVKTEGKEMSGPSAPLRPKTNREEVQANFETRWKQDPDLFDPLGNCMDRERLARTRLLIEKNCPKELGCTVDLGSGKGDLSRILKNLGARVTAVDIAKNALEAFRQQGADGIVLVHDLVPHTRLSDGAFDLVASTDLIGYLPKREHRLYFSELARLASKEGYIVCSTPIDYNSEDALDIFREIAETELEIIEWRLSFHKYYLKFLNFLKAPEKFARARKDPHYREKALAKRTYLLKYWFKLNSLPLIGDFWNLVRRLSSPIHETVRQSKMILLGLERICRFISPGSGVSHAIFIARRRPLVEPELPESPPVEMKQKKRIWE